MLGLILLLTLVPAPEQTVQATSTAVVAGQVVARDGGALPGVFVILETAEQSVVGQFVTQLDGAYRIADIAPGRYTVRFTLGGFLAYARQRLVLESGQTHEMVVALEAQRRVTQGGVESASPASAFDLAQGEVAVGVETSMGTFYIAVDTGRAPITATNFLKYVDAGLYGTGRFHRATRQDNYTPSPPSRPMMNIIQGGINPDRRREGFPAIPLERTGVTGITHVTGVVSMARGGPDSATSDFFVLLDDQPSLDEGGLRFDDGQGGAAFGHVLSGLDVARKVQQQPVDGQNLVSPVAIYRVWRLQ